MQLASNMAKHYHEANDSTSVINIKEEDFSKHKGLVSVEDVNMAAELHISNKQCDKALEVITDPSRIILEREPLEEGASEKSKDCR